MMNRREVYLAVVHGINDELSFYSGETEKAMFSALAAGVRQDWKSEMSGEPLPERDEAAIEMFFDKAKEWGGEWYEVIVLDVEPDASTA